MYRKVYMEKGLLSERQQSFYYRIRFRNEPNDKPGYVVE